MTLHFTESLSETPDRTAGSRWLAMPGLATLVFAATVALPAHAQFSDGAVIVTVPSDPEPEASTRPKSKPKPAAKPAPRKRASRSARRAPPRARPTPRASQVKIAVLVNDDPITQYDISQRASLLAGQAAVGQKAKANFQSLIKRKSTNERLRAILKETIDANRGRSREQVLKAFEKRKRAYARSLQEQAVKMARSSVLPGLKRKAIDELIDERLKLQAAKQAKVLIGDSEVDRVLSGIAKRNNLSLSAFKAQLRRQGGDINAMRARIRASMSWMRLVNAKFGRLVDINQKAIDESVSIGSSADKVSLHLHRLVFKLPAKIDQRTMAQRMLEAEQLRGQFSGCQTTRTLAKGARNVVFQDLGYKVATAVAEPTRSLLLNSRDGEMAPPVATPDGVTLYAVCARRSGAKSLAARDAARRNLQQKGTEIYARKYLSDLRREAHIEYRN